MTESASPPQLRTENFESMDGPTFWFRLFNEVGIINQLSTAVLEQSLADGLKAADFRLLNHFMRLGGPKTPLELATAFQITKGTMTHTIKKMSALGLVTTVPHGDDGRSKLVDITDAGRAAHARSLQNLMPDIERIVGKLDGDVEDELRRALPALVTLRKILDRARD